VDRRPVAMVGRDELAGDLARLAAAAGCELDRANGVAAMRGRWSEAPLVLLDAEAAAACAIARLPRRDGVVIATAGTPPPDVWERAVAVGAEHVATLPDAEPWLVGALADAAEAPARPGRVLAVLGGRGGAGASVLAAAVAVAAAAEQRDVLLVDCDVLGGGLDLVLGAEDLGGLRWSGLAMAGGRLAASSLHAALPAPLLTAGAGRLTVLSCDRDGPGPDPDAVHGVCAAGRRAGEVVVCDVPRHPCDAGSAALQSADLAVLVVPAEVRACAGAATVAAWAAGHGAPLHVVVRGPAPGGLAPAEIAEALALPLLAAMRPQPGLAGALDRGQAPGRGRGPLARAAAGVLARLDECVVVNRSAA
jgi:secretion/DNA translocation related CpaE-like protein